GRDGHLIVMDSPTLYEVDPQTGQLSGLAAEPTAMFYYGNPLMGFDIWENRVTVGSYNAAQGAMYSMVLGGGGAWAWVYFNPFLGLLGIVAMAQQPFEVFGIGCPNST